MWNKKTGDGRSRKGRGKKVAVSKSIKTGKGQLAIWELYYRLNWHFWPYLECYFVFWHISAVCIYIFVLLEYNSQLYSIVMSKWNLEEGAMASPAIWWPDSETQFPHNFILMSLFLWSQGAQICFLHSPLFSCVTGKITVPSSVKFRSYYGLFKKLLQGWHELMELTCQNSSCHILTLPQLASSSPAVAVFPGIISPHWQHLPVPLYTPDSSHLPLPAT